VGNGHAACGLSEVFVGSAAAGAGAAAAFFAAGFFAAFFAAGFFAAFLAAGFFADFFAAAFFAGAFFFAAFLAGAFFFAAFLAGAFFFAAAFFAGAFFAADFLAGDFFAAAFFAAGFFAAFLAVAFFAVAITFLLDQVDKEPLGSNEFSLPGGYSPPEACPGGATQYAESGCESLQCFCVTAGQSTNLDLSHSPCGAGVFGRFALTPLNPKTARRPIGIR
jgi:hypothetical protein